MKDLTKGYPARVIVFFALPIIIGNILQMLYNMVDSMIVSNYINEDALAAVGATAVVSNTLIGFINGGTQGFAIPIARFFGANDRKAMKRYIAGAFYLTAALAVIFTVSSLLFIRPLLLLLHTPDELMNYALSYVNIILTGTVFTALYNVCANILRAVGDSKTPLYFLLAAVLINIGLDLLFVKYMNFGIQGAAYATIISQGISGILTLTYMLLRYRDILPGKNDFRVARTELTELISTGLAMALMSCIVNIGTIILQIGINSLGKTIIAAHTAARKIFDIMTVFLYTIGVAMTTFVSQNIGAGKPERVKQGVRHAIIITTAETVFLILFCFLFAEKLLIWLTGSDNQELIAAAVMYIKVSILNFFWLGPLFVLRCTMQGMGRKIIPLFSSAIELTMKIIATIVLAPLLGYFGIAITEPISWFCCTLMLSIVYLHTKPEQYITSA